MFHPSIHLPSLVSDDFPSVGFEGAVLLCVGIDKKEMDLQLETSNTEPFL